MTAENVSLMAFLLQGHATGLVRLVGFLVMKVFAIGASIAIFFLIYWLLPNGEVPARAVLPSPIIMGLLSSPVKDAPILPLPWLHFHAPFVPFALSLLHLFSPFS